MRDLGFLLLQHLGDLGSGSGASWDMRRRVEVARESRWRPPWTVGVFVNDYATFKARLEEEAGNLLRAALTGMEETLGAEHPQTRETRLALDRLSEVKVDGAQRK
jgi:hypothetical protein